MSNHRSNDVGVALRGSTPRRWRKRRLCVGDRERDADPAGRSRVGTFACHFQTNQIPRGCARKPAARVGRARPAVRGGRPRRPYVCWTRGEELAFGERRAEAIPRLGLSLSSWPRRAQAGRSERQTAASSFNTSDNRRGPNILRPQASVGAAVAGARPRTSRLAPNPPALRLPACTSRLALALQ